MNPAKLDRSVLAALAALAALATCIQTARFLATGKLRQLRKIYDKKKVGYQGRREHTIALDCF